MKCENCQIEHDGAFATGRFCSAKCARSFAAKTNMDETNKKRSETLKKRHQLGELTIAVPFKKGYDERREKRPHVNSGYKHSDETKLKIIKKSFERSQQNFLHKTQTLPFENLSQDMRRKVLFMERGNKCEACQLSEWLGFPLSIQIDHIDGNHKNNKKENQRLLCPNCHSLTPTWKGRNITTRISREDFIKALQSTQNIHQALKLLGLVPVGGNYSTARKLQAAIN